MTAEIAVFNKSAVALAADSAVSVRTHTGQKIYNTSNKLFSLSKCHPVGIMIYGSAELNAVPWETLIKIYRKRLGSRSHRTINNYGADFIRFLMKNSSLLRAGEKLYFQGKCQEYLEQLKNEFLERVSETIDKSKNVTTNESRKILSVLLQNRAKQAAKVPVNRLFRGISPLSIVKRHRSIFAEILESVFQEFGLTRSQENILRNLVGSLFVRETFDDEITSGVVISGFGDDQHYPAMMQLLVEGSIEGRLKYTTVKTREITTDGSVLIMPFAQSEMVATFMEGVDPNLREVINEYLENILVNLPRVIVEELAKSGVRIKPKLTHALNKQAKAILAEVLAGINQYCDTNHTRPVVNITGVLPKDELAAMAEALVNLTSFRRRVSYDQETVGGPIDVAVISKGDGLVWIKRKHYFNPELNRDFFAKNR